MQDYDYGRKKIASALGLTGIEADHIAQALKEKNIDFETIDWEGAISDSSDWGNRYDAVKYYLLNYYGIDLKNKGKHDEQKYEQIAMDYMISSKEGVKQLLNKYYNQSTPKKEKEEIKKNLLNEAPVHNILVTALYDGVDMPLAKRFLNDVLREEKINEKKIINNEITVNSHKPMIESRHKPMIESSNEIFVDSFKNLRNKTLKQRRNLLISDARIFLHKQAKDTGELFKLSAKQLRKDIIKKTYPKQPSLENLKQRNELLRQRIMPLQLQIEYEDMLRREQQMRELTRINPILNQRSNAAQFMRAFSIQMAKRNERPIVRQGYHIEARPKLPKGFRLVKNTEQVRIMPKKYMRDYIAMNGMMPRNEMPMRMRNIPPNVILIRQDVASNPKRMNRTLGHENREMKLMQRGISYKKAHRMAGY